MKTEKIITHTYDSGKPGPTLLILGAIHGDEVCGTIALGRLAIEIEANIIGLEKGKLITAPICNPEAYRRNTRLFEANLNRVIRRHETNVHYEHHLAHQVVDLIDRADIVLDLHSYGSGTKPFIFLDNDTPDNRAFAEALAIPYWVTGWNETYAAAAGGPQTNEGDTMSYAQDVGKTAVLVECGAHKDPASAEIAYQSIRRALAYFGMMSGATAEAVSPQINRMTTVVVKEKEGSFAKPWQHLDPVSKGALIVSYADGTELRATEDGVVILPKKTVKPGDEWFYLGTGTGF